MASLEEGLVAVLKGDATLNALINGRVFRERLAQEVTYPAVLYQRIGTSHQLTLAGPCSLADVSLRVDIVGRKAASVEAVADALRPLINGVTGNFGGATVQHVFITNETDVSIFAGDQDYLVISFDVMAYLHE